MDALIELASIDLELRDRNVNHDGIEVRRAAPHCHRFLYFKSWSESERRIEEERAAKLQADEGED
jgi:hypothetical protein